MNRRRPVGTRRDVQSGDLYYQGHGVPQDYTKARQWYEKAAAGGDADAMNDLGLLYEQGLGVPQDYPKAKEWYEKAADAGSATAMNSLAFLYQGQGCNRMRGRRENGTRKRRALDAAAMGNLAVLYDQGDGVPQDYRKPSMVRESGGRRGPDAMYNLGYCTTRAMECRRTMPWRNNGTKRRRRPETPMAMPTRLSLPERPGCSAGLSEGEGVV